MEIPQLQFGHKFSNSLRSGARWSMSEARENAEHVNDVNDRPPSQLKQHRRPNREAQMKEIEEMEVSQKMDHDYVVNLLRTKEIEVQTLQEELETLNLQRDELQDALSETQTIIEQQQDQLTEFRRRTAQSETDVEAFKLKSIFMNKDELNQDNQLQAFASACCRLQAEVEALTGQTNDAKRVNISLQNENEFLKRQLEDMVNQDSQTSHNADPEFASTHTTMHAVPEQSDLLAQHESMRQYVAQQQVEHNDRVEQYEAELADMQAELNALRDGERDWLRSRSQLLDHQRELEEDRRRLTARLDSTLECREARSLPTSELSVDHTNSQNGDQETQLRRLAQERNRWKSYACSLVRSIVENCEEFLQKTCYNEPEFTTAAERRWYDYSMYLLEGLLDTAPHRLVEMDLHLLKRSISARRPTEESQSSPPLPTATPHTPDILSAVHLRTLKHGNGGRLTSERVARLATRSLFRPHHSVN